jgi:ATP-dependent Clp protease ATP-binding subunit ClpA
MPAADNVGRSPVRWRHLTDLDIREKLRYLRGQWRSGRPTLVESGRWPFILGWQVATAFHHAKLDPIHLLLGLLDLQAGIAPLVLLAHGFPRHLVWEQISVLKAETSTSMPPTAVLGAHTEQLIRTAETLSVDLSMHYIGSGHLLLSLLSKPDGEVHQVLQQCPIPSDRTRQALIKHYTYS